MIQDAQKIKDSLMRIYKILELEPEDAASIINDLAKAQQLAVATELMGDLNKNDAIIIKESEQKTGKELDVAIESIAKNHINDQELKNRAQAAIYNVLNEHAAYLKSCGDNRQKEEIKKILAEIGL